MKGNSITSTHNVRRDYSKLIFPENQINYEEIDQIQIGLETNARSSEYYEIGMIRSSSNLDRLLHKTAKYVHFADCNQQDNGQSSC